MNSQKMIRLSVIAALAGVYGSAFAGTTYDKGTNFIDQTYENVVGTQPSKHEGAVMAFYPTNADDVFRKLFKTPISERWGKQICLNE